MRRPVISPPRARFDRSLWVLGVVTLLFLAATWWFPYSTRDHGAWFDQAAWIAFLVRALGVHIGLGLLLLVALAAVRRRWVLAGLVTLIAFVLAAPLLHRGDERTRTGDDVRVMSSNVLYSNTGYDRLIARIDAEQPDILVLQEYTLAWDRAIGAKLDAQFRYAVETSDRSLRGLAIFSQFEIVDSGDTGAVEQPGVRPAMRAVLDVRGAQIAVYDVHPVTSMSARKARIQRLQVTSLIRELRRERLPVIVAGDMNFTETSRPHAMLLDEGLRSGWNEGGSGRGTTWNFRHTPGWMPGLRLDHIFASDQIEFRRVTIGPDIGSDHRPLLADVRIDP